MRWCEDVLLEEVPGAAGSVATSIATGAITAGAVLASGAAQLASATASAQRKVGMCNRGSDWSKMFNNHHTLVYQYRLCYTMALYCTGALYHVH